jgi:hypothetical protein
MSVTTSLAASENLDKPEVAPDKAWGYEGMRGMVAEPRQAMFNASDGERQVSDARGCTC